MYRLQESRLIEKLRDLEKVLHEFGSAPGNNDDVKEEFNKQKMKIERLKERFRLQKERLHWQHFIFIQRILADYKKNIENVRDELRGNINEEEENSMNAVLDGVRHVKSCRLWLKRWNLKKSQSMITSAGILEK